VTDNNGFLPAVHQLCGRNLSLHFNANIQYPRRPVSKAKAEAQELKRQKQRLRKTQAAGPALSRPRNPEEQEIYDQVITDALNSKPASQHGFTSNTDATIPQLNLKSMKQKNRGPKTLARDAAKNALTRFQRQQGFEDRQSLRAQHPYKIGNAHKDLATNEDGVVNKDEFIDRDGSTDESEVGDGDAEIDPIGEEVDNHKHTAHGSNNSNELEAPSQTPQQIPAVYNNDNPESVVTSSHVIKQTQQSEQVLGLSSVMTTCEVPPLPGPIVASNAEGRQRTPTSLSDSTDSPHHIVPSNADGTHDNPIPISDSPDLSKPSKNVPATSIDHLLGSRGQGDSSPTTYR
jgi:hypothetical protein